MKTTVSYWDAAIALWGVAGGYAHDRYAAFRAEHFPELPSQLPIVIGLTAYGHCVGLTAHDWQYGPRINLASELFNGSQDRAPGHPGRLQGGKGWVDDVLIHEMLHVWLGITGQESGHKSEAWYAAVRRLSPAVLGRELDVRRGADRKSVRVANPDYAPGSGRPKTIVRKVPADVAWVHGMVARWPSAFRPEDYNWGERIPCPSY